MNGERLPTQKIFFGSGRAKSHMTVCAGLIPPFLILPLRKPRMLF
nr:MAG TPA: hypothetical protein [Caudoviricetes sp.]